MTISTDAVNAERKVAEAEDALAAALAHGTREEKQAARDQWREAQRELARTTTAVKKRR